jgi:hypothetical protein
MTRSSQDMPELLKTSGRPAAAVGGPGEQVGHRDEVRLHERA